MKSLFVAFLLITLFSCDEKEPKFSCNANTISVVNGTKECGASIVSAHSQTESGEEFRMQIAGGYQVRLLNQTGLFEEGKTYTPYELYFSNLNKHFVNEITIVKLDRANKLLTIRFNFDNEAEHNFQAYPLKASGEAKDLPFQ